MENEKKQKQKNSMLTNDMQPHVYIGRNLNVIGLVGTSP